MMTVKCRVPLGDFIPVFCFPSSFHLVFAVSRVSLQAKLYFLYFTNKEM